MRILLSLVCLGLVSSTAFAGDAASAFPTFCEEWMGKLAARERDNVSHIKWDKFPDGSRASTSAISPKTPAAPPRSSAGVPVGKIVYREIRYEKRGDTVAEAEKSPPRAVEATEVTEFSATPTASGSTDHGRVAKLLRFPGPGSAATGARLFAPFPLS